MLSCEGDAMGLDLVEFVMAVEEAFELRFPDEDMIELTTPRKLIDYVAASLSAAKADVCLSQRAFYRLRSSLAERIGCPRSALRPDTSLLEVIPVAERHAVWDGVRQELGLANAKRWPRLDEQGWFDFLRGPRICTLRDAALTIATHPEPTKGPDTGWTREQISAVIHRLIREELGLAVHEYMDDTSWQEMGID
jgi:hypothetical protein